MREELTAAIEQRKIVTFTYQGQPRRVQPAAYGTGNRKGKETLHAYQVDGGSKRGGIPHWRNFYAEQIESLTVLDEVFGPNPPGFNPRPFPNTLAALSGGTTATSTPSGGTGATDTVVPGLPLTNEQVAKGVEAASKALGALGKWFKKR